MLNVNERMDYIEEMDYTEEVDRTDNSEEKEKNQFEFCNSNYNVNYFGLGPGCEEWI